MLGTFEDAHRDVLDVFGVPGFDDRGVVISELPAGTPASRLSRQCGRRSN